MTSHWISRGRVLLVCVCVACITGCVTEERTTYEPPGSGEPVEVDPAPEPREDLGSVDESLPDVAQDESSDSGPATLEEAMALLDDRPEWQTYPPIEQGYLVRHPAEKFLEGMLIVLDPGHGGDAEKNWKQGPSGVREAEMNLRVAKLLEKLLVDAGAEVHLTRDRDNDLSLADRAKLANDLEADFFISLHHNAVGDPETNYGSVWYHGGVNEAGPELDLARHVGLALGRHMRTQVARSSPIFSDSQMYNTGFGVLRSARVPAILLESSFYTNPDEEQRLRDALYNLREAYAVYEGLCEYAYHGTPTQEMRLRPAAPDELLERVSNLTINFEFGPITAAQLVEAALADRGPVSPNVNFRITSVTQEGEAPDEPGPTAGASTRPATAPSTQASNSATTTASTRAARQEPRPPGNPLMLSGTLQTGLPEWWGHEKGRLVAPSVNLFADGEEVDVQLDETTGEFSAIVPADTEIIRIYHENLFGHRNHPQWFAIDSETLTMTPRPSPRLGSNRPPTTQPRRGRRVDAERPWRVLPEKSLPILLLQGGDTKAQQIIDAIDLPEGSAMTIASIDPAGGDIYALRWRDSGQVGFYPASTIKLATGLMTLRQLHDLAPDAELGDWQVQLEEDELTGETAESVQTLLRDMIADSSNEAFNTLQEVAGFAETQEFLQSLGMEKFIIRRHFTRPHRNNSRAATLSVEGGHAYELPARPSPELPHNAEGGESNHASTDDFIRLLAGAFMTDARELRGFDVLAEAMRSTNEPFIKNGLDRVGDGFVVFNKPGWYPLMGVHCDAAYVYDTTTGRHYFVAIYYQGPEVEESEENLKGPRDAMAEAIRRVFEAIREGGLRL